MVLEEEIQPYAAWFPDALLRFGQAALFVLLAAAIISFFIAAFRHGPIAAGDMIYRAVVGAIRDLIHISPRRVWALARLAVQEAIRRRVWVALVAFGVILMFAGWFLDPETPAPGPLYLTFVLSWTTYLIVLLALFISTFSLPADIKNRTIYTVVTKPVRAAEIVLGRIVGFTLIGTALLAVMGVSSYFFVVRALEHTHELRPEDLTDLPLQLGETKPAKFGTTRTAQNHQHDVEIRPDGIGRTAFKHGHRHSVREEVVDGQTKYIVGPHEDMLTARVPSYGRLRFLDRDGQPAEKGINVGKESEYRSFLEGGTLSAGIWTFENIDENMLFGADVKPEDRYLPLELTIRVFRTHKGTIDQGITGNLALRNPQTQLQSEPRPFTAKEFAIDAQQIPRSLRKAGAPDDPPIDLFKDLVHEGRLEVVIRCLEPGQYFGAAQPDLYIRASDASFDLNFVKGYVGIWLQMVLVIGIGVMFSTFLSGAVAMLATLGCLVMGFFTGFVSSLVTSVLMNDRKLMAGGGPVEAFIRLITQKPLTVPFEDSTGIDVVYWIDKLLLRFLQAWTSLLPDFGTFSDVNFVASGFNVPGDLILEQATRMAGYLLAAFLAGLMFLRMREVAR